MWNNINEILPTMIFYTLSIIFQVYTVKSFLENRNKIDFITRTIQVLLLEIAWILIK